MKKLMSVLLGLSLFVAVAAPSFGADENKPAAKKKMTKKERDAKKKAAEEEKKKP